MPPAGSRSPSPHVWSTTDTVPTLADIALPPRRRLRDGSTSTASSRSNGTSSRPPAKSAKRTRSERSGSSRSDHLGDPQDPNPSGAVPSRTAEESRRLPKLNPRARSTLFYSSDTDSGSDGDDKDGAMERETNDAQKRQRDEYQLPPEVAPTSASTPSTGDPGERRFTAQEKGKGRAVAPASPSPGPEIVTVSDDEEEEDVPGADFDESIQFISSTPASEPVAAEEEVEGIIDEDSSLSAFSEQPRYVHGRPVTQYD